MYKYTVHVAGVLRSIPCKPAQGKSAPIIDVISAGFMTWLQGHKRTYEMSRCHYDIGLSPCHALGLLELHRLEPMISAQAHDTGAHGPKV